MLKRLIALIAFTFTIIISSNVSFAMTKTDIKNMLESTYSFPNGISSETIDQIYNKWEQNQDYYLITRQGNNSFMTVLICQSYNYVNYLNVTNYYRCDITLNTGNYVWENSGNKINSTDAYGSGNFTVNVWSDSSVDFNALYYSAQIPVPSIDVYMDSNNDDPLAGEAVWNASVELGDNSEYYIQWGIKISYPTYIDVALASFNGNFSYNYYTYVSGTYSDIVTMESLTQAVAQGATSAAFQSGWESTYEVLKNNPPEFGSSINAMNQNMINNAAQYYIDYMMTQMPMYGNRLEVFARYFTIDTENNSRVVVGAWNHWNSKDGSRTKERPSNYIDNVALPGNINTNTDPNFQDNTDTYNPNGDSTGTPATIINNNYAPNYPDYPTVATYNHDNILLNFMDTAKQLPSFFGEFTSFLTVAFGFIPSWIWTIIGMGFTFSIVIMIIKVL